jgi:ribosome-associated protein
MLRAISLELLLHEVVFTFARSSGPGGQNVNKVNSKAVLRWNPLQSILITEPIRQRFINKFGSRLTNQGDLILTSDQFRDQARNKADCVDKLVEMLTSVLRPPKKRLKTKPTRSSQERRHQAKRQQGERKKTRSRPIRED